MAKEAKTPTAVLKSLMEEYQLNPYSLAKAVNLSQSGIRQIVIGKTRISAPVAFRLAKFFGNTPDEWLTLQNAADIAEANKNEEFQAELKTIQKVKKPAPAPKAEAAPKGKAAKEAAPRAKKAAAADKPKRSRKPKAKPEE